jgi:hypothetical protein
LLFLRGRSNLKAEDSVDAQRVIPSNRTDADDVAVAVVLTLELAKITRVLAREDLLEISRPT